MLYLYHKVPSAMQGHVLYPLNELKNMLSDVYAQQVKKYEGREVLLERKIPILNCLWNDVLHMSAVDPHLIKGELAKNGRPMNRLRFYKIDPHMLEQEKTIVYLYRPTTKRVDIEKDFVPFNFEKISEYTNFPEETKKYYAETIAQGGKPLLWHYVPHILYKGSIDVSNLEILEI
jgi:hypothetical protein